jgi:hypothetical protein
MISASNSNMMLTLNDVSRLVDEHTINPCVAEEIKNLTKSRDRWKTISNIVEIIGHFFLSAGTILLFASSVYNCDPMISFVSGCINVVSLALLRFGIHAYKESKERNDSLEILLHKLNQNLFHQQEVNFHPQEQIHLQQANFQNFIDSSHNEPNSGRLAGLQSPPRRPVSRELSNNSFGKRHNSGSLSNIA